MRPRRTLDKVYKRFPTREVFKAMHNGTGSPAAEVGEPGDIYMDTDSLHLYGPKTDQGWGKPTSLLGTPGTTGPGGMPGPAGATGSSGAVGATGPQGITGATGAVNMIQVIDVKPLSINY